MGKFLIQSLDDNNGLHYKLGLPVHISVVI